MGQPCRRAVARGPRRDPCSARPRRPRGDGRRRRGAARGRRRGDLPAGHRARQRRATLAPRGRAARARHGGAARPRADRRRRARAPARHTPTETREACVSSSASRSPSMPGLRRSSPRRSSPSACVAPSTRSSSAVGEHAVGQRCRSEPTADGVQAAGPSPASRPYPYVMPGRRFDSFGCAGAAVRPSDPAVRKANLRRIVRLFRPYKARLAARLRR